MHRYLLVLFCSLTTLAHAQYWRPSAGFPDLAGRFSLHLIPSYLLDHNGARVMAGGSWYVSRRWEVTAGAGIPFNYQPRLFRSAGNQKIFSADQSYTVEVRRFIGLTDRARFYLGLQGFYRHQSFHEVRGSYVWYFTRYEFGAADVNRSEAGGAAVAGFSIHLGAGFLLEPFGGVGLKQTQVDRTNVQDLRMISGNSTGGLLGIHGLDRGQGGSLQLAVPTGIRIAWVIGGL